MKGIILFCTAVFLGSASAYFSVDVNAHSFAGLTHKSAALADSPVLGTWEVTIAAPGQDLAGTLKISKSGENFAGSLNTDLGEAPLKNIKIKDDSFTADITADVQGQSLQGTMNGKLTNEKLAGNIDLPGFGAIPYTGKKPQK